MGAGTTLGDRKDRLRWLLHACRMSTVPERLLLPRMIGLGEVEVGVLAAAVLSRVGFCVSVCFCILDVLLARGP